MKQKLGLMLAPPEFEELQTKFFTACIVIPTYNERDNIIPLIEKIFDQAFIHRKDGIDLHVLVVDDSSPDGTADAVREYQKHNSDGSKVHLLVRKKKEGLGMAYIHGMKHAMKLLNPDYLMEMDADGQHNPNDIYRLLKPLADDADFVIGSRYIDGGSVNGEWGWKRKFISWCAGTVTNVGLGLGDIKDSSGGFRAIKSEVLEKIDLDNLHVKGYAFQAALLEAAVSQGFTVAEAPIHFDQRTNGESKMRFKDMMEGWKLIYHVRKERIKKTLSLFF